MIHEHVTAEIQEVAALYALGSLNQHELRDFEFHLLEGCHICRAEALRFEKVVAGMALGTSELDPPAYVRDLLMARVEREPRTAASSLPKVQATAGIEPSKPLVPVPPPFSSLPAPERTSLPWIIAVACSIAVLLSILAWRRSEQARHNLQDRVDAAQGEANQLRAILESERARSGEWQQVTAALGRPGTRLILLAGQAAAPSAAAAVLWDVTKNEWFLSGNFPPPPGGKSYQLWLLTPKVKINAALLKTDLSGHSFVNFEVPMEFAKQITQAEVTLEPAEGSAQPSLPVYALGKASP